MIIYPDGNYETGAWLNEDTYPDKEYYVIDEGSDLAYKALNLKYRRLIINNGVLIDVEERQPTPNEIEANKPQKSLDQIRIEQLETENAMIALELAESQERLNLAEQSQAELMLQLVEKGVL